MVRTAELGELFSRITTRNTARVASRVLVCLCRHSGPRKRSLGGFGIAADEDGHVPGARGRGLDRGTPPWTRARPRPGGREAVD
eukprot:7656857-Lingulodinium_polyedra.AAC.1